MSIHLGFNGPPMTRINVCRQSKGKTNETNNFVFDVVNMLVLEWTIETNKLAFEVKVILGLERTLSDV